MPEDTPLDQSQLFAGLSVDDVGEVLAACEPRLLVAGEELFEEGEAGDAIWIVQGGRLEIFTRIGKGVDRVLASMGAGDVVGEMSFIDGSRRSAGARTTDASEFLVLRRPAFEQLAQTRPQIAATLYRNLAGIVAARLRATNELYRETVRFSIEATGAHALNLLALSDDLRPVTLHLASGDPVTGRILQVDQRAPGGPMLIVKDSVDRMTLVPFHAIQRIEMLD